MWYQKMNSTKLYGYINPIVVQYNYTRLLEQNCGKRDRSIQNRIALCLLIAPFSLIKLSYLLTYYMSAKHSTVNSININAM